MRLEIFDFIDDAVSLVEGMREVFEEANWELEYFFKEKFLHLDNILNVSSRVKSSMSLKEKIFRNNFYLKYQSPEELVENLTDLIGIRIECRFIEDEEQVYNKLFEVFDKPKEEGYYCNEENPNIMLRLGGKQPQLQKNGFGIYKIDGQYIKEEQVIKFELQIKSLVNVFWGEVEHKVLYKNYKYLVTEELFKDIMYSLKENLSMIDRQLMILYNHLKDIDESSIDKRREQLESILSKIIYEIYSEKTKEEFGFVVDYRKSCDVIVSYVLRKNGFKEASNKSYDEEFIKVLERVSSLKENEIYIDRLIEFEREIRYEDSFCKKIGEAILEIINKDFKWNLFFKIIFQLGVGNKAEEFEGFLIFLRNRFYRNLRDNRGLNSRFSPEEREEIIAYIMDLIADSFINNREIDFINDDNIDCMNEKINITLNKVMNYETWKENIKYFTDELTMKFNDYK